MPRTLAEIRADLNAARDAADAATYDTPEYDAALNRVSQLVREHAVARRAERSTIPLRATMNNGATVADWLGTAMTAATLAARRIEDIRTGSIPAHELSSAIEYLEQALEEARAVQSHCR